MASEKMLEVSVYCDSTDLFTEDEIMKENICELQFPEWIVRKWYQKNLETCICEQLDRTEVNRDDASFENWFENCYTCESTDGLYDFALRNGFHARR